MIRKGVNTLLGLVQDGYLRQSGWLRSVWEQSCVDRAGRPVPWMTYAAVSFLEPRLRTDMSVFEYGSGSSTRWWASRVGRVISCEHDLEWYQKVSTELPANVTLVRINLDRSGAYSRQVAAYGPTFDVVVIDGRDRVNCARNSVGALSDAGVIVWDNSDRPDSSEGYAFLAERGFRRLDFSGMGPLNSYAWCTSVFYRSANCLGI